MKQSLIRSLALLFGTVFLLPAQPQNAGLKVISVEKDGTASRAGLEPGDVILAWTQGAENGSISWPLDFIPLYREHWPRGPVTLHGKRQDKEMSWPLTGNYLRSLRPWGIESESASPAVQPILNHISELLAAKQIDAAVAYCRNTCPIVDAENGARAFLFFQTASLIAATGQMKQAGELYSKALAESPANRPYFKPLIYRQWGKYFIRNHDLPSAGSYYEKAFHEWETLPQWPLNLADDLEDYAVAETAAEAFQPSLDLDKRALAIRMRIAPRHETTAITLQNLANTAQLAGDLDAAVQWLRQGLDVMRDIKSKSEIRGALYFTLAGVFHRSGNFADTDKYYLACLDEVKKLPRTDYIVALTLGNLGGSALERWNFTRAEFYLNRAIEMEKKEGASAELNLAVNSDNLAELKRRLGDDAAAEALFQKAIAIEERLAPQGHSLSYALSNYAILLEDKGDLPKAKSMFARALAIAEAINPRSFETAMCRDNLARIYDREGHLEQSEAEHRSALEIFGSFAPNGGDYAESLAALASVEAERGKSADAMRDYSQAIGVLDAESSSFGRSDSIHFGAEYSDYHNRFASLLLETGQTTRAFEVLDASHARTLVRTLDQSHVDLRTGISPSLLATDRKLETQLSDLSDERIETLTEDRHKDVSGIDAKIAAANAEHDLIENQMRAANPRYAALTQTRQTGLRQLRQFLEPDTALLEYALGHEQSFLIAVDRTRIVALHLPPKPQVEGLARTVYKEWSKPGNHNIETSPSAQKLSNMVLAPAADFIKGKRRLLIVADGALHYVPFAALPAPKQPDPSLRVASLAEVVNLPSASLLIALHQHPRASHQVSASIAIVGDPVFTKDDPRVVASNGHTPAPQVLTASRDADARSLADDNVEAAALDDYENSTRGLQLTRLIHSREEAEAIASVSPKDHLFMALDFDANRAAALKSEVSQSRIIHFATHGIFDARNPAMSGLVFSLVDKEGKPQAGFLGLDDIYRSHVSADLVVLSACETALGEEVNGEGLVGLTWGFIYAGAKSVVASLWRVNDASTAELMRLFYDGIERRGLRPAAALRQAQLAISQKPQWASPYYWAGFVIEGDDTN